LLGKSKEDVLMFSDSINERFDRKWILEKHGKTYLLLLKTQNDEKANDFINSIEKI
jgi:hypothetical protein